MDAPHPGDTTLLAYVEDELGADERAAVEEHLAACPACTGEVAASRAARDALRSSPLLDVPTRAVLPELPARRPPGMRSRRLLRVAAPIAAALALGGGIATLAVVGGGGGNESSSEGQGAGGALAGGGTGQARKSSGDETARPALAGRVAGPADDVARRLRRAGFHARANGPRTVVVRTNRVAALQQELAPLESGAVAVRIRPPKR